MKLFAGREEKDLGEVFERGVEGPSRGTAGMR